jgi:hypothetical protein
MEINKKLILVLDLISMGCLFFMKLLIWPIFLTKESKDADGVTYQRLTAVFLSIGLFPSLTFLIFWFLGKATTDHLYVSYVIYLLTGMVAHFIFKKEFGESFLV